MPNPKTGGSRWVPDIRPENISTFTETNGDTNAEYKLVDAHPILGGILDKLAFFRTHVGAVWYNKLGGKTLKQKLDEMDSEMKGLFPEGSKSVFVVTGTFTTDSDGKAALWNINNNLIAGQVVSFTLWSNEYGNNVSYEVYCWTSSLFVAVTNKEDGTILSDMTFSYMATYIQS